MTPVIRIDDEVMEALKKRAKDDLTLVFEPPNTTLRKVLGLDSEIIGEQSVHRITENEIEIELNNSAREYVLIPLPRDKRLFFPGFMVSFEMITDAGMLKAHVTSSHLGALKGDPNAGVQIRGGLGHWYTKHPELKAGDKIRIKALEPGKRYELSIVDKVIASDKSKVGYWG
jgi:hypothetical protein